MVVQVKKDTEFLRKSVSRQLREACKESNNAVQWEEHFEVMLPSSEQHCSHSLGEVTYGILYADLFLFPVKCEIVNVDRILRNTLEF